MAEASVSDKFAQIRGFTVEIEGDGGKDYDVAWESISGGDLCIEMTDTTIGGDPYQTKAPGHKSVNELVLRGAMTDGRKGMCEWINKVTTTPKGWERKVTITEKLSIDGGVKDGKKFIYHDCFPTGYVFPRMSVTNTAGNVMEEIRIKPVRCELM